MGITLFAKIGYMAVVAVCVHLFQQVYHANVDRTSKTHPLNVCGCGFDLSTSLAKYLASSAILSNPPDTSSSRTKGFKYMVEKLDVVTTHPDCGVVLLSFFNRLDICYLLIHQNLKQTVRTPTRSEHVLDLIVTNLHELYNKPSIIAPLGTSDHNVVKWTLSASEGV